MANGDEPERPADDKQGDAVAFVNSALKTLRFEAILLTVHEGRVVQLDITEKRRFAA